MAQSSNNSLMPSRRERSSFLSSQVSACLQGPSWPGGEVYRRSAAPMLNTTERNRLIDTMPNQPSKKSDLLKIPGIGKTLVADFDRIRCPLPKGPRRRNHPTRMPELPQQRRIWLILKLNCSRPPLGHALRLRLRGPAALHTAARVTSFALTIARTRPGRRSSCLRANVEIKACKFAADPNLTIKSGASLHTFGQLW